MSLPLHISSKLAPGFLRLSRCPWASLSRRPRHLASSPGLAMDLASSSFSAAAGPGAGGSSASAAAGVTAPEAVGDAAPEAVQLPPKPKQSAQFCRQCGGRMGLVVPQGDSVWRDVCQSCGFVDYQNPKMVCGCIVEHEGRILLVRRGIQPQRGLWTVPAGFMEMRESSAEGAARETWEEAGARVEVQAPYVFFDIPGISQAYILFRARLAPPYTFAAQPPESLEAQLFAPADIPWDELAFSSVSISLRHYLADLDAGFFHVHHGVIVKRPGSGPNEAGSFSLENHVALPTTLPSR